MPNDKRAKDLVYHVDNELFFADVIRLLGECRLVEIVVRGNSMRPFLRHNRDSVVLERCATDEPAVGQVVLFRYGDKYVLHRIERKDGQLFCCSGDANLSAKEIFSSDQLLAVVRAVRRNNSLIENGSAKWRFWTLFSLVVNGLRRPIVRLKHKLKHKDEN